MKSLASLFGHLKIKKNNNNAKLGVARLTFPGCKNVLKFDDAGTLCNAQAYTTQTKTLFSPGGAKVVSSTEINMLKYCFFCCTTCLFIYYNKRLKFRLLVQKQKLFTLSDKCTCRTPISTQLFIVYSSDRQLKTNCVRSSTYFELWHLMVVSY